MIDSEAIKPELRVYAISFKERGTKQVKQTKPHVLLILASSDEEAVDMARTKIKEEYDGDMRTPKWAGTSIPLIARAGDSYICWFGNVEESV